ATRLAKSAVEHTRQLVIVSGGDGTVNEVVNGLAGSAVPMALLPSGTANVLAKELALPWNIPQAAAQLKNARLQRIALGSVTSDATPTSHRYFINVAGAGPDGHMIQSVNVATKKRFGILAYYVSGVQMFFTYRFPIFQVKSAELDLEAKLLIIGRTKAYATPMRITTRASLLQDSFEVMASIYTSRWRMMRDFPALVRERLREVKGIYFWKTNFLRIEPIAGQPHVYAQVDGEIVEPMPMEFRVVPDMLTLALPEDFRG
ncbi:MAG: NAD(+)/NADH kinase, partial [Acidobacteria bacterium]|nr:NAD(+)/NADH kinase [Acidobacteriota bacterium]